MLQFKLDENFSPALADLFLQAGHYAETVFGEQLSGEPDERIFERCQQEGRCLVTFDLDFSNILRFPAQSTSGIIVIRPKRPITLEVMNTMTSRLISLLENKDPTGCLWVMEPTQLRIRKPRD